MDDVKAITKVLKFNKIEKEITSLIKQVPPELQDEFFDIVMELFIDVKENIKKFLEEREVIDNG